MSPEKCTDLSPFILSFDDVKPVTGNGHRSAGKGSSILGKVTIGSGSTIGAAAVIRADGHFVTIGDDFWIGANSTVHIAHGVYPAVIGDNVAVGHNSVVHACIVGNGCLIEDGVVVLDGSVVDDGVLIEANSTVFPRSILNSNSIYAGSPAKFVRVLTLEELEQRKHAFRNRAANTFEETDQRQRASVTREDVFVARTAVICGHIDLRSRTGVFFSCILDAGTQSITVRENTNIQDNSRLICHADQIVIGADTTIGHNVLLKDCRVGARCLIGIGARLSPGTVVEDDVLVAAGSMTEPGQRITGGQLWAGRPARPLGDLTDVHRNMMREIIEQYCDYGAAYRLQQADGPERRGSPLHSSTQ